MGKSPYGPWSYRDTDDVEPTVPRPLDGHWFGHIADVIHGLARQGIVSGSYEECEMYEVAAMLGSNEPREDSDEQSMQPGFDPLAHLPPGVPG